MDDKVGGGVEESIIVRGRFVDEGVEQEKTASLLNGRNSDDVIGCRDGGNGGEVSRCSCQGEKVGE